jgi:hypothetical protein
MKARIKAKRGLEVPAFANSLISTASTKIYDLRPPATRNIADDIATQSSPARRTGAPHGTDRRGGVFIEYRPVHATLCRDAAA